LRFTTTKSATDEPDVSFSDYVARMKDGQEDIYYVLAPSIAAAKVSPHLEAFRTKDVEVLLLGAGVDNWVVSSLREFDGKKRLSTRLTTSPACIVGNEPEVDINLMQRLRGTGLPRQAILELNPHHPLISRLNRRQDDPRLADWAHVLFSQAILTLGARIENPTTFVDRLNDLLMTLTGGERDASDSPGRDEAPAGDQAG
jgi:molecular chaperone HtpG